MRIRAGRPPRHVAGRTRRRPGRGAAGRGDSRDTRTRAQSSDAKTPADAHVARPPYRVGWASNEKGRRPAASPNADLTTSSVSSPSWGGEVLRDLRYRGDVRHLRRTA